MARLDLNEIPIVDHHAHPLWRREATQDPVRFRRWFTESTDPEIQTQHVPNLLVFRTAVRWLAEFLQCAPTVEAILETRAAISEEEYAARLFRAANIGTLLCDYGYGGAEAYDSATLSSMLPCPVHTVLRLERLAEELLLAHATFDGFVGAYDAALAGAHAGGVVSFKSIIAYRTGLAIDTATPEAARLAFRQLRAVAESQGRVRLANKPLCDFIVQRALQMAATQGMPVQFHTGFGDADADLRTANPLHLRPVIEGYPHVPLVLLHAGWPYHRELTHLASIYPNVWMDLSLAIPFATTGIPAMIRDILGMAPFGKVMFATDAFTMPEIFWVAARWGRWGLGQVLEEFVDAGFLSEQEAHEVAWAILSDNARRLYRV